MDEPDEPEDEMPAEEILKRRIMQGLISIDEAREELGLKPWGLRETRRDKDEEEQ